MKQGKVWGETCCLFSHNNVEVHRILTRRGGVSSRHRHAHKFNQFYVERGTLQIDIEQPYGLIDKTILRAGDSCVVSPGLWHRFKVLEDCTLAFEFYWVQLDSGDIERDGCGGMDGQGHDIPARPGEAHRPA